MPGPYTIIVCPLRFYFPHTMQKERGHKTEKGILRNNNEEKDKKKEEEMVMCDMVAVTMESMLKRRGVK